MKNSWQKGIEILKNDGVVVLPTDTLYGVVGKALSKRVIEKIYKIKGRDDKKPFIVLINSYSNLEEFNIKLNKNQLDFLKKNWPGKISVILSCQSQKLKYLHRGTNSIAFRMIGKRNKNLFKLIDKVGPIVAPSANPEGENPARNITEAKKYFGDKINLYINGKTRNSKSSTLIKLNENKIEILRQGEVKIKSRI